MLHRPIAIAGRAFAGVWGIAWAATAAISTCPNPCEIPPGAHECGIYATQSTEPAHHARRYARAEGGKGVEESEFAAEPACAKCRASRIEAGTPNILTLVDFPAGSRDAVVANVLTAFAGQGPGGYAPSGVINAEPNPCQIPPGEVFCTTYLSWSTNAVHARVYVATEGRKPSPEKEFGSGRARERRDASWIAEGSRYIFTLYDFSTGSRGRALASVVVTGVK